jgi:ribosomal protein S18 acetylase RimI-like enzyme
VNTLEVVSIGEPEIATCAAVLGQAFHQDPLQIYIVPDPATRRQVSPTQLAAALRYGWLYGAALTTKGDRRGAAVWLRPGETEFTASRAEAAGMVRLSNVLGPEASSRSLRIWRLFAETRAREAGAQHWYLMVIGVLPEWQGHGIGSALMRPVLALADMGRLPCFVETVQPRNRPLYERHGFRLVWDHVDAESGLQLLSFLRLPRAGGA